MEIVPQLQSDILNNTLKKHAKKQKSEVGGRRSEVQSQEVSDRSNSREGHIHLRKAQVPHNSDFTPENGDLMKTFGTSINKLAILNRSIVTYLWT